MPITTHVDELREPGEAEAQPLAGPGVFADRIAAEFSYSLRHGVPLSLIVVELPKDVHLDASLRGCVRAEDVVARIDRRRVAVIAPRTTSRVAATLSARLRSVSPRKARIGRVTLSPECAFDGPGAMLRAAEVALH